MDDIDQWKIHVSDNQYALDDEDFEWFLQSSLTIPDMLPEPPEERRYSSSVFETVAQERDADGNLPGPRYFQDASSKVFLGHSDELPAPNCGFPICNALTQDRRIELLMDLRDIVDIDIRDPIFSLNSMKQGIHLWSRELATEYCFLHRETLFLYDDNEKEQIFIDTLGEKSGPQLVWSVISCGWALTRSIDSHEVEVAAKIQRAIRNNVLRVSISPSYILVVLTSGEHERLSRTPPLWLVQTLFIVLLFTRFSSSSEDYCAASMYHGVLLESVLRIDHEYTSNSTSNFDNSDSAIRRYASWVTAESFRR